MSECLVSIIIPAYNAERYIRESIESVLRQSANGIECIVVDDGSKDKTPEIVKGFGSAVRYLRQDNAERSVARNNGLLHANGKYISFLDADDYISPEKIAEQVQFLENHLEYEVVYSKVRFFTEGDPRVFSSPKRITPSGDILAQLMYGNFITMHSPLIRKSAIDRAGGFDPRLSRNEDWEFLLRLSISGARFAFMDTFHAYCRLHAENTSSDVIRMHESKWRVAEMFVAAHFDQLCARMINCPRVLAHHEADYGKALILSGDVPEGRRLISRACREPIPGRIGLLLLSLAAGLFGSKVLRRLDAATHGMRKWKK
jgi:glycosyltransferase involved in cell wall biosynthesis